MNKIKFITKLFVISVGFVLTCTCELSAHLVELGNAATPTVLTDEILEQRIENLNSQIDVRLTPEVKRYVRMYTQRYPQGSEALLGRVSLYFPLFETKIRERGLPDELKYLSVVESSLRPNARSNVGAMGLWQFMRATARMYDLKITRSVDERRDPERSTEAALQYLNDLHQRFDDWTLALAAYNCGPGNVQKAIRRANSRNFWELRRFLPKETRDYVPRYIAIAYLMHYYHMHDLQPKRPAEELQFTASTKVYDKTHFREISQQTGVDVETIRILNPEFILNYIPKNDGRYALTLPENHMHVFAQRYTGLERVVYGQTEYNYSATTKRTTQLPTAVETKMYEVLVDVDDLASTPVSDIRSGLRDNVPKKPMALPPISESLRMTMVQQEQPRFEYYRMALTETLRDVADRHEDVTLDDLIRWNEVNILEPPKPGAIIKIRPLN